MSGIGFNQDGHEKFAGPGHWNDPDMLVVGKVGWGPHLHPTKLTPNEQYTHITLWSLLSSPLLIGCDMTQLDDFTRGLLTNDEVIDVNQDPLGRPAGRVARDGATGGLGRATWRTAPKPSACSTAASSRSRSRSNGPTWTSPANTPCATSGGRRTRGISTPSTPPPSPGTGRSW